MSKMSTTQKQKHMQNLMNQDGIIAALAIDQRGALKKMMTKCQEVPIKQAQIEQFKTLVSEELTGVASSILLDPKFGLPAAKHRAKTTGLLLAYEKTGYNVSVPGRLPDLLVDWSAND